MLGSQAKHSASLPRAPRSKRERVGSKKYTTHARAFLLNGRVELLGRREKGKA